jgi:hypothetical protein
MLFLGALGQFDLSIYGELISGSIFGEIFHIIFLLINLILFLNLIIAILTSCYEELNAKKLALFYD